MMTAEKTTKYTRYPQRIGIGYGRRTSPRPQETLHLRPLAHLAVQVGLGRLAQVRGEDVSIDLDAARDRAPELVDAAVAWAEQQPATMPDSTWGERWDLASTIHALHAQIDPIVRPEIPVEPDICWHGVPFADDCDECED